MKLKEFSKQVDKEQAERDIESPLISDISIDKLLDAGLLSLSREIKNLTIASSKGKLSAPDARDLRDHIKLLFDLKAREKDVLNGLTDEQIKTLLASINDSKQE